eukprot:TRINITY_DN10295_c0_g1_i1.p1 TRINITY_DN10295_c0_g1~~TRINITY_DN10295_c0_g1_i1.p1  ORF type:complete len:660 (-),score=205.10 TRINITY_DN10295_c0_g1_i1:131-2056(-)
MVAEEDPAASSNALPEAAEQAAQAEPSEAPAEVAQSRHNSKEGHVTSSPFSTVTAAHNLGSHWHDVTKKKQERRKHIVGFLASAFFEDQHYKTVATVLSSVKDKRHVINAAAKLLISYGVEMSAEEQDALVKMDEAEQISALVAKLPQQADEQFQQFFVQLQRLVMVSHQVRLGLEQGDVAQVEDALQEADDSGIAPIILRMAVVQAGSEMIAFGVRFNEWSKENSAKTGKLIRCQEDAMTAKKKLAAADARLGHLRADSLDKVKHVLMNFLTSSDKTLIDASFKGWAAATRQGMLERKVEGEYEAKLAAVHDRILQFQVKQKAGASSIMNRQASSKARELLQDGFELWREVLEDRKADDAAAGQIAEMEQKIKTMKASQAEQAKKLMLKMSSESDAALLSTCLKAFAANLDDEKKERDVQKQVEANKGKMESFLKNKSAGAKYMLETMNRATDSGLLYEVWGAWTCLVEEAKKENRLVNALNATKKQSSLFAGKAKEAGMSASDRARIESEKMLLISFFNTWRLDAVMEARLRVHHMKVEAKRQQLMGVQTMFRNFALQLESGLKGSESSRGDKKLSRSATQGDVSLPEINQKGGGSGRDRRPSRSGGALKGSPVQHGRGDVGETNQLDEGAPQPRTAWT